LWRLDDRKPFPLFIERKAVKKVQTVTVKFNGTPRMGLNEGVEILL
jgi:hypothetical protein